MPRTIVQAVALPAPPERLYAMYLDPVEHAAFTGNPVKISAERGAPFEAFEGALTGVMLHTQPSRLIVQSWRSVNFAEDDLDSTLVLSFSPHPDGGRIELTHVNVPEQDFSGVSEGWGEFYWTRWRQYLESTAG